MRKGHRRTLWIVVGVLGVFIALMAAGLLARDSIASFAAGKVLASRGYSCDDVSVHVPLKLPPTPLELSPTRCEVKSGPLQVVEFKEPLFIHLSHFKLGMVTTKSLAVDLRPRAHREVERNTLGDLTSLLGADETATELMFDSAKLSEENNPPVLAEHATTTRAKKPIVEMTEMRVTYTDEGVIVTSPKVHLDDAAILGNGILRMVATPTAVTTNVQFAGNLKVKVVLDHVDATKPKIDFSIAIDSSKPAQQSGEKAEDKKDDKKALARDEQKK